MKIPYVYLYPVLTAFAAAPVQASSLSVASHFAAVSAEIISYDPATGNLVATAEDEVQIINFTDPASMTENMRVSFDGVFVDGITVENVSSVAADPLGRGFAAACLINSDDFNTVGKVVIFSTSTGSILNTFNVGYHPDCVHFSDDGAYIVTADEGEWEEDATAYTPGSVSVIAIGASTAKSEISSLSADVASTYDFSDANLADGVTTAGLRVTDPDGEGLPNGLEPEYVSSRGGKVYVSIQESSVIGVLDIASGKWEGLYEMPAQSKAIDASDKDNGIEIDDTAVLLLPMPDGIDSYEVDGHVYVVTANEGDFRTDDGDKCRVKNLGEDGAPALDADYLSYLNGLYDGDALDDAALGRLNVSILDGLNDNGEIEQLYAPGARSFSIVDAETGSVVWDSGSDFETITAELDPEGYDDDRSDDKGPEPEGVCIFTLGNQTYAAIVMERTYAVFIYNITDPLDPQFADYYRVDGDDTEPESVLFVSASQSGDGEPKLVVSYEDSRTINALNLATWNDYLDDGGYINTFDWLGTIYESDGWIYSYGLDSWLYMDESWVDDEGAWAYVYK